MNDLLLDTCAIIWLGQGEQIAPQARNELRARQGTPTRIWASPFSAWEIGALVSRNRLRLPDTPDAWFRKFLAKGRVGLTDLSPTILMSSWTLPALPPNDPADRIVLATARALGLTIMTRDRKILDYAEQGHAQSLPC